MVWVRGHWRNKPGYGSSARAGACRARRYSGADWLVVIGVLVMTGILTGPAGLSMTMSLVAMLAMLAAVAFTYALVTIARSGRKSVPARPVSTAAMTDLDRARELQAAARAWQCAAAEWKSASGDPSAMLRVQAARARFEALKGQAR